MWLTPDTTSQDRPQLSTDGWKSYFPSIRNAFGGTVRHGAIIKNYQNPEVGRFAPPDLTNARRFSVSGIERLWTICTSHIERFNLSVRTFLKRFTRLALGFSKKLDSLKSAVALFVAYYNFCWRPRENGNSGKLLPPPAMSFGLVDRLWSLEDLFDEVTRFAKRRKAIAGYRRLADRLTQ